jgi:hypothetical protein
METDRRILLATMPTTRLDSVAFVFVSAWGNLSFRVFCKAPNEFHPSSEVRTSRSGALLFNKRKVLNNDKVKKLIRC